MYKIPSSKAYLCGVGRADQEDEQEENEATDGDQIPGLFPHRKCYNNDRCHNQHKTQNTEKIHGQRLRGIDLVDQTW